MSIQVPFLFYLLFLSSNSLQNPFSACCENPVDSLISPDVRVINVKVSGEEGAYTFDVTLESSDTGCEQYANWWEVVNDSGTLVYRRILGHSHVNEQPFTRSGGPIALSERETVIIRGHMNNSGYGSKVFMGSVADGFRQHAAERGFAPSLEKAPPLPEGCAF